MKKCFIFCYDEVFGVQQERWISTSFLTYLKNIDNAIQDFSSKLIWHGMKSKWIFCCIQNYIFVLFLCWNAL
jgi:hypothetical protein